MPEITAGSDARAQEICNRILNAGGISVRSVRLGGSTARGCADEFSDLDVFVLVEVDACHAGTAEKLADALGPWVVRDVPRADSTWGTWVTAWYFEFGYVDLFVRAGDDCGVTYMADSSSRVLFDRDGGTTSLIAQGPPSPPVMSLFEGLLATAWLRAYKAARELRRNGEAQFEDYLTDVARSVTGLHRLVIGKHPPGRNYDQALRGIEVDSPEWASRLSRIIGRRRDSDPWVRLHEAIDLLAEVLMIAEEPGTSTTAKTWALELDRLREMAGRMSDGRRIEFVD